MKIYVQNNGWRGCIVVIAESEEEARTIMDGEWNYDSEVEIISFPITKGYVFAILGDS